MNAAIKDTLFSLPVLGALLLLSLLSALFFGAYRLSATEILQTILKQSESPTSFLILHIRLPRVLLAALVGAGLAISGASIQGLFRNPLADQTLIGVTSGAMLFAVTAIMLMGWGLLAFPEVVVPFVVTVAAFVGGLLTTFLVYRLSKQGGKTNVMTMLLAGIAISAFAAAAAGIFIYLSDDQRLRDITFWSLGSFNGSGWLQLIIAGPIILGGILLVLPYSKALNAILLGEAEAQYLGIRVEIVKTRVILLTALMVGVSIAMSGIIGFVGLIIPHFLRLLKGADYRYLLRSSALAGAIFLVVTDTLSRTVIAPAELPIGILTSMIGAPFFLWLLLRTRKEHRIT